MAASLLEKTQKTGQRRIQFWVYYICLVTVFAAEKPGRFTFGMELNRRYVS